jgi:hypothetical protein
MLAPDRLAPPKLVEFVTFLRRFAGAVGPGPMTFHRQDRGGRAIECSIVDVRSTNMEHAKIGCPDGDAICINICINSCQNRFPCRTSQMAPRSRQADLARRKKAGIYSHSHPQRKREFIARA